MKYQLLALSIFALYGCGGGGGSDGGSEPGTNSGTLTVPQTTFSIAIPEMDEAVLEIPAKLSNVKGQNIYATLEFPEHEQMLSKFYLNELDDSQGIVELTFNPGYMIGSGEHNTTIKLHACYDSACTKPLKGSPTAVTLQASVTVDRYIEQDIDAVVRWEGERGEMGYESSGKIAGVKGGSEEVGLYYQSFHNLEFLNVDVAEDIDITTLNVTLSDNGTMDNLDYGLYSDAVSINACYDPDCLYKVAGSPVSVPVEILLKPKNLTPEDAIELNKEVLTGLNHNFVHGLFLDSRDLLVIASSNPENAVHIYNIQGNLVFTHKLSAEPEELSLAADGRLLLAVNDSVVFIDISDLSNPIETSYLIGQTLESIASDGTTIWSIVKTDDQQAIGIYDIDQDFSASSYYVLSGPTDFSSLHFDSQRKSLILQNEFQVTEFSVPSSLEVIEQAFYPHTGGNCHKLWLLINMDRWLSSCGDVFEGVNDENSFIQWEKWIPLVDTWDQFHDSEYLKHAEESRDGAYIVMTDGELSGTVRIYNTETEQIVSTYYIPTELVDGQFYKQTPEFVVITSSGDLFGVVSDSNSEFYLVKADAFQ
ncbi:hypothetical protein ACPV5R_13225 [Vibrio astriarenae]